MIKTVELKPIKESTEEYEEIEKKLKAFFKAQFYAPLLRILKEPQSVLKNSADDDLLNAIKFGRIEYSRGTFHGKLNASITKALKDIGAKWDNKTGKFRLPKSELPISVKSAISASRSQFEQVLERIDKHLSKNAPEAVADKLKLSRHFDQTLWKVEKSFKKSIENLTIAPELTADERKKISDEYTLNMDKWINDFMTEEIVKLRKNVQASVFSGLRRDSIMAEIQKSYGVSEKKAKFLARQETGLLMAKYKETRYKSAGIEKYRWQCVSGSPAHPVRPWHRALQGKIFSWDDPPNTAEPGKAPTYNNPGEDWNCRCVSRPLVTFKASDFKK